MCKLFVIVILFVVVVVVWQQYCVVLVGGMIDVDCVIVFVLVVVLLYIVDDVDGLLLEVCDMLVCIVVGGLFEYVQDGIVFGNYEGLLLQQLCGYYYEYIVEIFGVCMCGVWCIIIGGMLLQVYYYIDDYYCSFCCIEGCW